MLAMVWPLIRAEYILVDPETTLSKHGVVDPDGSVKLYVPSLPVMVDVEPLLQLAVTTPPEIARPVAAVPLITWLSVLPQAINEDRDKAINK